MKSILPNKLTSSQRARIKLAKLNQSAAKTAIKEAGSTARSIVSSLAANRTIQHKIGSDALKKQQNLSVNDALKVYNSIMGGNPSGEGSEGSKQSDSTTEVGGSGSRLGG